MASVGHLAAGLACRWMDPKSKFWPFTALVGASSFAPDLDVLAFAFGIPYAHDFGHRGATHSIAFALMWGVLVGLLSRRPRWGRAPASGSARS